MSKPFIYSSIFGDLTRQVQVRIDAASELRKRLFDQPIYSRYMDWDAPTIGLNFEELIGSYNLSIAAVTLDSRGKDVIMGNEGLETIAKKVLRHTMTYPMPIEEYRKILQILDSRLIGDSQKAQQLVNLMWKGVANTVQSVEAKLDIIFLGALSNEGVFTFDDNNNPEGGVRGVVDYKMPASNKASATTAWTEANINTVDCFEDIQQVVDAAGDKVVFEKILLDRSKLSYMLRNKALKQVILGTDKKNSPLMLTELNTFLQQNEYPILEVIRRQTRIQNNGRIYEYKPWNAKNLVFVPSGKLGTVKNAYADSELKQDPGVSYSNYGRIRVSQWGIGEKEGSDSVEFTKAQSWSLPVFTEMNGIFSLKTE